MKFLESEQMDGCKFRLGQAIRIVIGIVTSILFAELAGIQFAPSTGVVALLGIQNTKRESLKTLFRRTVSFIYTLGIAVFVHEYIGGRTLDFVLLILIMVIITMLLNWENTLSINVVIALHLFMQTDTFSTALLMNETKRIIIGVSVAMIVNWSHKSKEETYEQLIVNVEEQLKTILNDFAKFLRGEIQLIEIKPKLKAYSHQIQKGIKDAYFYANNNLLPHARYYVDYMKMREKEYVVLENTYELFMQLHQIPDQAVTLADNLEQIAKDVPVRKPMDEWLVSFDHMKGITEESELPSTVMEFEDDAILLFSIRNLQQMIRIRQSFISALTPKQLKRYHHEG